MKQNPKLSETQIICNYVGLAPTVVVWLLLAMNTVQGGITTFAFTVNDIVNGKDWLLIALLVPCLLILALHLTCAAMLGVERMRDPRKNGSVTRPDLPSYCLLVIARIASVFYLATFVFWGCFLWPKYRMEWLAPVAVTTFAIASYFIAYTGWAYGFKNVQTRVRVPVRGSVHGPDRSGEYEHMPPEHGGGSEVAQHTQPKLRLRDLHGNAEIKRKLIDAMNEHRRGYQGLQAERNGILMMGEPGNGKTILAEALAGEANVNFLKLTHTDVASMWVGERTVKIRDALEQAKRSQPCILFIDEIDSFLPDRSKAASHSQKEDADVVNTLLTLLVDIRKYKVLVVAATNYIDRLDPAAIREGRFDFKIEITPPDEAARIGLLRSGLKTNTPEVRFSNEIILNVAQRWNGFSVKRILAVTEEMPSYLSDLKKQGLAKTTLEFNDFGATLRRVQGRKGVSLENVKRMDELVLPGKTRDALELIASRLKDPVRVERLGGTLPTGVLFYGPPGTGKTVAAKALAKQVGSALLIATGPELAKDPKELEKLYSQAKDLRPALIFIDEADDLLRSREYSNSTESTNKLLTLMDGVNDRVRDVIWVAATNNPDQIDSALLRGGRFTEKVEFLRPSEETMAEHIDAWLKGRKMTLEAGLTAQDIAQAMGDESIANAEAMLLYAANRVISNTKGDHVVIAREDFEVGKQTVLGWAE